MQNRVVILQVAAAPHFIHSWREALTRANTGSVCSSSTTQSDGSSSPRTTHHNSSLPMIATNSLTEMLPQTHSFHPFQPLLKEKRQKNFYLFFVSTQFSFQQISSLLSFTEGLSCCPVSGVLSAAHCLHHQACLWGHISLWFLKHGTSQGPEHGLWKETGETGQQVQTLTWRTQRYVMTVSLLLVQYWSIFSLEHWKKKTATIHLIQNLSQNAEFNCVWKLTISFGKKNNKSISLYK